MWKFAEKNHITIFIFLIAVFLLLWNLDRYLKICPWGLAPAVLGIIFEVVILIRKKRK